MSLTEKSTVVINLSHQEAQQRLGELRKEAVKLKKSLDEAAMGSPERKRLRQELAAVEKQAKDIRKELRQKIDVIIDGKVANAAMRDLRQAARELKTQFELSGNALEKAGLAKKISAINTEITKQNQMLAATKTFWQQYGQEIKSTFIGNLGANLATLGLQKIAGYITGAFDSAVKLSDEFANIAKTTGMTVAEVAALNAQFKQLDTRTSLSDLREIARVGGQFGVAKTQMLEFVRAMDEIVIAMGDDFAGGVEEVTRQLSTLRNIFTDIKSDNIGFDLSFIGNALNELAASGAATAPVITDFANRIGGVGINLGLTTGEVLGISATLQELGVTAERGGTAVVKILQKMLTNTSEFARIAGMGIAEFKHLLNTDLFGAFTAVMHGSNKLGNTSTELAAIIKDLEVQGAGASEVFAKLGKNTEMLQQKVDLAKGSMDNLQSILNEVNLKNTNMAAGVERLSKVWNKFISNPALVAFFNYLVRAVSDTIEGMSAMGDVILYNYQLITRGKSEADRLYNERKKAENEAAAKEEQRNMDIAVQGYKNKMNELKQVDVEQHIEKLKMQQRGNIAYLQELRQSGQMERYYLELKHAELIKREIAAAQEVLKVKKQTAANAANVATELTKEDEKALKKQQKQAEKAAAEKVKEAEKLWKDQLKIMDKAIDTASDLYKKDLDNFKKSLTDKWKALNDFWQKEQLAAEDLNVLRAKTDDERLAAEKSRIITRAQLEIEKTQEGSYQRLALEERLQQDLVALDMSYSQQKLREAEQYFGAFMQAYTAFINYVNAEEQARHNEFLKANRNEQRELKKKLDQGIINQAQYDAEIARLEAQREAEQIKMQNERAKRDHKAALFKATIETALAWVLAWIDPTMLPRAIAASAEMVALAAIPPPQFARGTKNAPEGYAVVGEEGPELVRLPQGADIYPAWQTSAMLNTGTAPVANLGFMQPNNPGKSITENATANNNSNNTVVIYRDEMLTEAINKLLNEGVQGYWEFDRFNIGKKRYDDAKSTQRF